MAQGRPSKAALKKKQSLSNARKARHPLKNRPTTGVISSGSDTNNAENQPEKADDEDSGEEVECTGWSGGVVHYVSSDEEPILVSDEEEDIDELSGSELEEIMRLNREKGEELPDVTDTGGLSTQPPTDTTDTEVVLETPEGPEPGVDALSIVMAKRTNQEWKRAETTRSLGYNGRSKRTKRHQAKLARDKETENAKVRKG